MSTSDLPSYNETMMSSQNDNLVSIIDELLPLKLLIKGNDGSIKDSCEIRSVYELIYKLNFLESTKLTFTVNFQLNPFDVYFSQIGNIFNNDITWTRKDAKLTNNANMKYEVMKTFLTFRYTPIPVVKCDCKISFGYFYNKNAYLFWSTSLSLADSIDLIKKLLPFNETFCDNNIDKVRYYISVRFLHVSRVCSEDNKYSNPYKILKVLEYCNNPCMNV
jgi:hypothetical protein